MNSSSFSLSRNNTTSNTNAGNTGKIISGGTSINNNITNRETINSLNPATNSNNNGSSTGSLPVSADGSNNLANNVRLSQLLFYSYEVINLQSSDQDGQILDNTKIISKIYRTLISNTFTLILPNGSDDGQLKIISLNAFNPSSVYTSIVIQGAFALVGRVVSEINMRKFGASVSLIWDGKLKAWYLVSSGALID